MAGFNSALTLWQAGRPREALLEALSAYTNAPASVELLSLLSDLHLTLGDTPAAAECLRRLATVQPRNAVARRNLGVLLERSGDPNAAAQCYRVALALDPTDAIAHFNLGNVLLESEEPVEALSCYRRAIALQPEFAAAWCNCAGILLQMTQAADALACAEKAVSLNPEFPEAWFLRAAALRELGRQREALSCCERALALRPGFAKALYVKSGILHRLGDHRTGAAGFREIVRRDPHIEEARMAAVVAQIALVPASPAEVVASRKQFAGALAELATDLKQRPCADATGLIGAMQPYYLAYQDEDQRELLSTYGRLCCALMGEWQRTAQLPPPAEGRGGRAGVARSRVRVGVVSAQVCNHSVHVAITRGWLRHLNRQRFEVNVFHLGPTVDAETAAARALADHFEQEPRALRQWARTILDSRPDILIYPEIGMDQKTLQLASMRLAPRQLASWGHPITTGLPTIDYFLSADAFEPPDGARHYTEQLVKLPHLGTHYEPWEHGSAPAQRNPFLGREATPLLICPGTPYKYSPEHDSVFVEIARQLENCQFHFFSYADGALSERLLRRLHEAFAAGGLDGAKHLVLRPWANTAEFHAILNSADLLLDTLGFSGFNTVMQALECDLPVVSYRGRFLRGRLGSGILERVSLGELVADSPGRYVELVVRLAQDARGRSRLRRQLPERLSVLRTDRAAIEEFERFLLAIV